MGMIKIERNKIVDFCDKLQEFFIYTMIFCLPFSKAVIEISAGFIIFSWIIKKILTKTFRPVSTYLNIPIVLYILAVFLSVISSSNFSLSLNNFITKTMEYIILYFIIVEFICTRRVLKNIVIFMVVSAAMIGIDCVFQYFFGFDLLRSRALEAGRITGSFQMPTDLAGFLGPILCLSLSLSFLKLKKGIKYFLRIESVLLLSLLIVSFARGPWIGFAAAICFLGIFENRKIFYVTIALLLVLGVIASYLVQTPGSILVHLKSITSFSDGSSLDRAVIWQVAIQMIKDSPVFGHGLSTFMGVFSKYGRDYYYLQYGIIPYAHNCYLQMAAETGIVGLASFIYLIGAFFIHTVAFLKKIKDRFYHAALSGVSAGIIVTLIHSAVDTNLYSLQLSVLFWVMLALNAALQRGFVFEEAGWENNR